jgi:hypothetical protein
MMPLMTTATLLIIIAMQGAREPVVSPKALSDWLCSCMKEESPEALLPRFPDTNEGRAVPERVPTGRDDHLKWSYEPDRFFVEMEYREQQDHPVRLGFRLRATSRDPARFQIFERVEDAAAWLTPLGPVVHEGDSIWSVQERSPSGDKPRFLVQVDLERQSVLVDWPNKWLAVHPSPLYQREFGPDFGRRFCRGSSEPR